MIVKYKGYEGIAYGEGSLIIRKDNKTILHTASWAQYPTEENIKRVIDDMEELFNDDRCCHRYINQYVYDDKREVNADEDDDTCVD
jgi:hypothetical protein